MAIPGLVIGIHGRNHEIVDVQFSDKTIKARNMLKSIKVGDYVILNNDLVIEIISEHEAMKRLR